MDIQKTLSSLQDVAYGDFQQKLIPTLSREHFIGVRVPALRKLAKTLRSSAEAADFLSALPHEFYEENMLHALLLEQYRDYDGLVEALEEFLPHVDNWAVCDTMAMKLLSTQPQRMAALIQGWLGSDHCYTVRFAIGLLMRYGLDERFTATYLQWVAESCCEEYYVNMMVAWYFATALHKQYAATVQYLEKRLLPRWVHNKTIQKAIESYRITPEQKAYLRTLRRKEKE